MVKAAEKRAAAAASKQVQPAGAVLDVKVTQIKEALPLKLPAEPVAWPAVGGGAGAHRGAGRRAKAE